MNASDLIQNWDDSTRTVTYWDVEWNLVPSTPDFPNPRPYTDDENKAADARLAALQAAANAATLRQRVNAGIARLDGLIGASTDPAGLTSLWAVRNTDDATINANPAPYIKGLAQAATLIARGLIQVCRIAVQAYADISDTQEG